MSEINAIKVSGITYDLVDQSALHDSTAYKTTQTAVSSPSTSGTSSSFIKTITQDTNGVITATKATLPSYKTSQTAVTDPSASGNSTTFIKSVTQDANGVISPLKAGIPAAVYITSQGTSSGWTYRKWSDKTYECWKTVSLSIGTGTSVWSAWGGIFAGQTILGHQAFPITFSSVPWVYASPNPNNGIWFWIANGARSGSQASTTQTGEYQMMRPSRPSSTLTYYVDLYVYGTASS